MHQDHIVAESVLGGVTTEVGAEAGVAAAVSSAIDDMGNAWELCRAVAEKQGDRVTDTHTHTHTHTHTQTHTHTHTVPAAVVQSFGLSVSARWAVQQLSQRAWLATGWTR